LLLYNQSHFGIRVSDLGFGEVNNLWVERKGDEGIRVLGGMRCQVAGGRG